MNETIKIELYNGSQRQVWVDTKGKDLPEDIFPIGLQETLTLDVNVKQIERIKSELPNSVLVQY